jgi:hypothetical protein
MIGRRTTLMTTHDLKLLIFILLFATVFILLDIAREREQK